MSTNLKLTKKQRKALQFRGKLEKPAVEVRTRTSKSKEKVILQALGGETTDTGIAQSGDMHATSKTDDAGTPGKTKFEKQTSAAGHAVRFIAFIGNLPFSATAEELRNLIKSANPTSVRLMTNKDTGKSRGFAFVEFSTSADLKHSLKFHHARMGTKKINVELTAGGGGNSENRKQKLKRRRDELEEERKKMSTAKRSKKSVPEPGDDGDTPDQGEKHQEEIQNTSVDTKNDEEYDYNDTKTKKPNRRKRGRGSHK
ncbi:hypothetical protein IW140_005950 [Coemansia sp. RSA 1813]|nr:hypothetical protein EV178_006508 [Coemansia sp. RSA 1646]KAJ1767542.1 hypothetical protein LPJ74_005322 [Coemansia sp. RSA 1843]KAJ2084970.1 hypothetical protein IW138_006531 [Coemansia sp. RSA 986]KAJ2210073.1 hypothetical protein EV179_006446 [Coemansia sp. RSA 487]KAJ2563888.1 hypothetical protein IW140_005950 [Coemansia sp. RSA 1813]